MISNPGSMPAAGGAGRSIPPSTADRHVSISPSPSTTNTPRLASVSPDLAHPDADGPWLLGDLPNFTTDDYLTVVPDEEVTAGALPLRSLAQRDTPGTANPGILLLQVIILFLSLSMLIYYGEQIWTSVTRNYPPKLSAAMERRSEITGNTIYSLIVIQISAALLPFLLAIPLFTFMGYGHELLFATMIGFGMLIPLISAQLFLLFFIHYMVSLGDIKSAVISMVIVYPLLSGWIDLYCHRSVHGGGGFHSRAGADVTRSLRLQHLY